MPTPGRSPWAGGCTRAHAWNASAAVFLIAGLAGIEILAPGRARLRVAPHAVAFPYRVVYPTPRGDVRIVWDGQTTQIDTAGGVRIEPQAHLEPAHA